MVEVKEPFNNIIIEETQPVIEDKISIIEIKESKDTLNIENKIDNIIINNEDKEKIFVEKSNKIIEIGSATHGIDGISAYQEWLNLGNFGSKQDFIDSLEGEEGTQGIPRRKW